MAQPRSRFAARARARQQARIPSRAERRAGSPREPRGALLRYQLAMRQVAARVAVEVRSALALRAAADDSAAVSADSLRASMARLKDLKVGLATAAAAVVRAAITAVADRAVDHSQREFRRLRIPEPVDRTDADGGGPRVRRGRGIGVHVRDADPRLGVLIDRWRHENVEKITSLVRRELDTIERILADGEGRRVESLRRDIEERFDVTRSKAELLARDQVLKLNANITRERQQAAGIEEYIWTTSGDERVRERHTELDGRRFRWDDPPVTNDQGDRNHPGEDYQCRCTPYPVLPELGEGGSGGE